MLWGGEIVTYPIVEPAASSSSLLISCCSRNRQSLTHYWITRAAYLVLSCFLPPAYRMNKTVPPIIPRCAVVHQFEIEILRTVCDLPGNPQIGSGHQVNTHKISPSIIAGVPHPGSSTTGQSCRKLGTSTDVCPILLKAYRANH